jgi:hypothetical protein
MRLIAKAGAREVMMAGVTISGSTEADSKILYGS